MLIIFWDIDIWKTFAYETVLSCKKYFTVNKKIIIHKLSDDIIAYYTVYSIPL